MPSETTVSAPDNEEPSLTQARERWIRVVQDDDLDAYVAMMSEDIVWLPPGTPAQEGREAMRTWLAPAFGAFSSELDLDVSRSAVHGDHAVEEGVFTATLTERSTGKQESHGGRYLALWRRGPDGWLLDRYVDLGPRR